MGLFNQRSSGEPTARISLGDAEMLSDVGRSLCARSPREARNFPGDFRRPVVRDPDYFARQAQKVFGRAIKEDEELGSLYLNAWSLSNRLERATTKPYQIGGPAVDSAVKLLGVTEQIQGAIEEKDLHVNLSGSWLYRAQGISAFALRIITQPHPNSFLFRSDKQSLLGRVYPGIPADAPVNSEQYWMHLHANLTPVPVA